MISTESSSATTYLIMGGARSGKSSYAEKIAAESNQEVVYMATANVLDKEIAARVEQHRKDRPAHWKTIEVPVALAGALKANATTNKVVLVDCLTMWISNLLMEEDEELLANEVRMLHNILPRLNGKIIFVSNEVGMGVIPMGELSRKFVDESGRLHQQLAKVVDNVLLLVAGLAMQVKGNRPF